MTHHSVVAVRVGMALLALALVVHLLPTAWAFTDGQAASLVLGQPDFTTGSATISATGMNYPYGVTVDLATGTLFVADTSNNRVLRFAAGTALVNGAAAEAVFGQPDFTSAATAASATKMNGPSEVAVDSSGRLWVADSNNNRVLRFDNAATKASGAAADGVLGQLDFTTATAATTATGMKHPTGVAVDSSGTLWVVDFINSRVLRFDNAATKTNGAAADGVLGQASFTTGTAATTATGMNFPIGVAVDTSGTLWVGDQLNSRVLRFDNVATKASGAAADGVLGQNDFTTKTTATSASGMYLLEGVAVDRHGRLFVADSYNHRVLRFDNAATKPNGAAADGVLGQNDFTTKTTATSASGMRFPTSVAVDSSDALWVADNNNSRMLRFDVPTPTITWANPAAITYGTALDATQLNATASVPGTFTYTPAAGTVLNAGTSQTLSVLFTPTDTINYTTATATVTIDVAKAEQTITVGALAAKTYGNAPVTVSATASSGLTVAVSSVTPSVCRVSGSTITLVGAGTCMLNATQAGDTNYNAAPQISPSFTVNKATLTATATNPSRAYGAANPAFALTYTGFVNGDTTAVIDTLPIASSAATVTSPVGSYPITVSGGADANYAIAPVNGTLTITKATLVVAADTQTGVAGQPLPPLTSRISGFVNGETASVVQGAPACTTTATSSSPAGSYPITCTLGTLTAANYTFTFTPGTLTLVAASVVSQPRAYLPMLARASVTSPTITPTPVTPTPVTPTPVTPMPLEPGCTPATCPYGPTVVP